MGQSSSIPVCEDSNIKLSNDDFQLSLDSRAFDYYILGRVKELRVSHLSLEGHWLSGRNDSYTPESPYEDQYVRIAPTSEGLIVDVLEPGVSFLFKARAHAIRQVLCNNGHGSSVLYYTMLLKKKGLQEGHRYTNINENTIMVTPKEILIITLPDRSRLTELEKADTNLLNNNTFLAYFSNSTPIRRDDLHVLSE
jgi:hypothetical protein